MIDKDRGFINALLNSINPYAWVTGARNKAFDWNIIESHSFSTPTICIGNITVGGTGKTPHTEFLVKRLVEKHNVAVLSRGYGRKSKGYIKATADTPMPLIGDEPAQIKNKFKAATVAVCEKRVEGIKKLLCEKNPPQVILLDDAYQHRYVKAGLNILLIDSNRPLWQDSVLPFGRMRESISGIKRADIVIITKCNNISGEQKAWCRNYIKRRKDIPVFFSTMRYGKFYPLFAQGSSQIDIDKECSVLLVTGIAKPLHIKRELESYGARVEIMRYGDHHNFTGEELEEIAKRFAGMKSSKKLIITTEKDATRLLDNQTLPESIKESIYALPIEVEILDKEEELFNQIIDEYVTENSRNSSIP